MKLSCLFGHQQKKYLSVRKGTLFTGIIEGQQIYSGKMKGNVWIIRWICNACNTLGQDKLPGKKSAWKVVDGKLLPDEDIWAKGNE